MDACDDYVRWWIKKEDVQVNTFQVDQVDGQRSKTLYSMT